MAREQTTLLAEHRLERRAWHRVQALQRQIPLERKRTDAFATPTETVNNRSMKQLQSAAAQVGNRKSGDSQPEAMKLDH